MLLRDQRHCNVFFLDSTKQQINYDSGVQLLEKLKHNGLTLLYALGIYEQQCYMVLENTSNITMLSFWKETNIEFLKEQNKLEEEEDKEKDIF